MPGIQDWLNIRMPVNKTYHINRLEKKNEMILSIDEEKHLAKLNTHLWKKILSKLRIEEHFLN